MAWTVIRATFSLIALIKFVCNLDISLYSGLPPELEWKLCKGYGITCSFVALKNIYHTESALQLSKE